MTGLTRLTECGEGVATSPPTRVQLSRRKGWRMPPNTVKVDRCTQWGNPHRVGLCPVCGADHTAEEAVAEYRAWLVDPFGGADIAKRATRILRGKNLACWCPMDQPCHADVLLEWANEKVEG